MKIKKLKTQELLNRLNEMALNRETRSKYYHHLQDEYMARDGQTVYRELHR